MKFIPLFTTIMAGLAVAEAPPKLSEDGLWKVLGHWSDMIIQPCLDKTHQLINETDAQRERCLKENRGDCGEPPDILKMERECFQKNKPLDLVDPPQAKNRKDCDRLAGERKIVCDDILKNDTSCEPFYKYLREPCDKLVNGSLSLKTEQEV